MRLVAAQQVPRFNSTAQRIRSIRAYWLRASPHQHTRSGYDKRIRTAGILIAAMIAKPAADTPDGMKSQAIGRIRAGTPRQEHGSREAPDWAGQPAYVVCPPLRHLRGARLHLGQRSGPHANPPGSGHGQDRGTRSRARVARPSTPPHPKTKQRPDDQLK